MEARPRDVARPYQEECFSKAKNENVIIMLPTGAGKTLVACLCIDHFQQCVPDKNVLFVVPTKALTSQQAEYVRKNCASQPTVLELCGDADCGWRAADWESAIEMHQVFVGTPEIFNRAMSKQAYLEPSKFSLIIFDECHHAVGNHPMAALCKDALWPLIGNTSCPRIIGFTASPSKESMKSTSKNMEKAMFFLQTGMQATLHVQEVPQEFGVDKDNNQYSHIEIPEEDPSMIDGGQKCERWLQQILDKCAEVGKIKDIGKTVRRLRHVFDQLGKEAFVFAVKHVVLQQLEVKMSALQAYGHNDITCKGAADELQGSLPKFKQILAQAATDLDQGAEDNKLHRVSAKAFRLLQVLNDKFNKNKHKPGYRGIVFVQEKLIPQPLANLINTVMVQEKGVPLLQQVSECSGTIHAVAVTGGDTMSKADMESNIEQFRQGRATVLVATAAVEEGVDIPDCELVVRFDPFHTNASHVQGSGRVRKRSGEICYFHNDPKSAQLGAKRMKSAAEASGASLTAQQRDNYVEACLKRRAECAAKHPFGGGSEGAEITVFTAQELVHGYCQQVMQTFEKADAYKLTSEDGEQNVLSEVHCPGPNGPLVVTRASVKEYWAGADMEAIFDPIRSKNYTSREKEEKAFLFVVARRLREEGFLNKHNEVEPFVIEMTRLKFPVATKPPQVCVKPKFAKTFSEASTPKQQLKVWADRKWPGVQGALSYETSQVPGGFRSHVKILKLQLRLPGEVRATKKEAEHAAAHVALSDARLHV